MKRITGTRLVTQSAKAGSMTQSVRAVGLATLCLMASPARAEHRSIPVPALLSHKVSYTLGLARLKAGSLAAASGHATYQLRDLCDVWSVSQKLEVQITSGDGSTSLVSYQSATLENKKGHSFLFRTVQTQDGETTSETAGEARRRRDGRVIVHFTKPEPATLTLPARVIFPMQFTGVLLDAAHRGLLHMQSDIFDGASTDGATPNYATLGTLRAAKLDMDSASLPSAVFQGQSAVPVTVASFGGGETSLLPDSTYSDRLWTNGVEDRLLIDFGDYVLSGQIETLTPVAPAHCASVSR